MTLKDWMDSNGLNTVSLGDRLGLHQSTAHRLISGKQFPSKDVMIAIAEKTEGAVMPNDWVPEVASLVGKFKPKAARRTAAQAV